jgi:hypothetical protein
MLSFFEFPQEVVFEMYQKFSPENLLGMLESGDKRTLADGKNIIRALFMQRTDAAKAYQEKIIQSWFESRTTYPFPFAHTHQSEFFEALKGLDEPYQIAGLQVLNQCEGVPTADNNAQMHTLLDQLVDDICQGVTGKEKMLALFSSKLDETHITTLLAWIQDNLRNQNARERGKALKALIALAPKLNETHIAPFSDLIQQNLIAEEYGIQDSDLHTKALIALLPKLNQAQIHKLLSKTMRSEQSAVRFSVQQALITLEPRLNKALITSFFNWVQEHLNHVDDAGCIKVVELLITLAPILNETQISLLIVKIKNNLNHENTTIIHQTLTAIIIMAPKLNDADITTLLPAIQHAMTHEQQIVRDAAQQAVIAMIPKLDKANVSTFLTLTERNLSNGNASLRISALAFLRELLPNLDQEHISPSLNTEIRKALSDKIYMVRDKALLTLMALALKRNRVDIIIYLINIIPNDLARKAHSKEFKVPLDALKTLASRLNKADIPPPFIDWIEYKLNQEHDWMRPHIRTVLTNLTPNLSEAHINKFLAWIETNLSSESAWMNIQALQVLTILKPRLNEAHIPPLLTLIQDKLNDENPNVSYWAKYALMALMPKLNETQITLPMITEVQNNLCHTEESIRKCALETLCSLAPRLNEAHRSSILDEIQKELGNSLKPEPALGRFLSRVCAPTDPHTAPIIDKLVAIITHSREESGPALRILSVWGLSWMQDIDQGWNIDECKRLINSLSFTNLQNLHPNSRANDTICALQEQWSMRLEAMEIKYSPSI